MQPPVKTLPSISNTGGNAECGKMCEKPICKNKRAGKIEHKTLEATILPAQEQQQTYTGSKRTEVKKSSFSITCKKARMKRFPLFLLVSMLCLFFVFSTVRSSATYPNTMNILIQAAFDPVYWLTTFHRMDLSRQVRSRWLRLLPQFLTGRLHFRPIYK
ncbi:uncharacterized protein CEXT_741501 [Caerostris extrusa]|uniref:Uncharacterized protein n=1 Tax=Caerostris extrusa TaxID=172846 RepID=A0AAV4UCX6_CAEEX|nr:uncharacterized protein CEXT_741501 [Caerostris extrusa]